MFSLLLEFSNESTNAARLVPAGAAGIAGIGGVVG